MPRIVKPWLLLGIVALGLASCGGDGDAGGAPTTGASDRSGSITVSAAASLTEAFEQMGDEFVAANPDASVTFNFGPSSTLATQITQTDGVGVDVFAPADEAAMERLVAADLVGGEPVVFARNRLIVVTKPGNPKRVQDLADLANLDVVSLCGETVPCGRYAADALARANVTIPETNVTRGVDVKATLGAVTEGDADAAIVYATDVNPRRGSAVAIPDAQNAIATYPIAALSSSGNRAVAAAFVDYVRSSRGRAVLRSFGFLPPR